MSFASLSHVLLDWCIFWALGKEAKLCLFFWNIHFWGLCIWEKPSYVPWKGIWGNHSPGKRQPVTYLHTEGTRSCQKCQLSWNHHGALLPPCLCPYSPLVGIEVIEILMLSLAVQWIHELFKKHFDVWDRFLMDKQQWLVNLGKALLRKISYTNLEATQVSASLYRKL